MAVIGESLANGYLAEERVRTLATEGLRQLPVDGRRVLVLIPDGTRTMPMGLFYDLLERELGPRVTALDFLVALGTHPPMSDEQLSIFLCRKVSKSVEGRHRIFNHRWDDPEALATLGTISAREIAELSGGRMEQEVPVRLNRLILEYDHILVCGPVFPHEVAGFSGGAKYFFPGIAAPEIIHVTHWLGALLTSCDIIGEKITAVRAVIHRALEFVDRPHSLLAPVVTKEGIAGVFCGPTIETWSAAAALSAERHIVRVPRPIERILAVMPLMYDDLWTGGKGMYKTEPAVADGGEVVIYAPHIREVSRVHGRMIEEIGYHCRDYFLALWDKFSQYPGGILAHSTHVKGKGSYDAATGIETPRIRVTLATGISEEVCRKINLGYRDPASVDLEAWAREGWFVAPQAGEMLYRVSA